jgi:hypothetical protein
VDGAPPDTHHRPMAQVDIERVARDVERLGTLALP